MDFEYLIKLRNGDESGLRYFMSQYGESLRFFAFKITKDKEISEEVVSESFYKFWEKREQLQSLEHTKSFLYLVTRNACYDQIGSAHKQRIISEDQFSLELENSEIDVLTQIIYVELLEQIANELEGLPEKYAEVFKMAFLQGVDTKEISEALGISASSVYHAKSKALAAMRLVFKKKDISMHLIIWLLHYLR